MSPTLAEEMRPFIRESMSKAGAVQAYDRVMGKYKSLPFVLDVKANLTDYVIEKGMDGIHAEGRGAHLRGFIVSDRLQGKGFGSELMELAVNFSKRNGYRCIYLWTFEGLSSARHLYEKNGFRLVEEHFGTQWGKEVKEQRFELRL